MKLDDILKISKHSSLKGSIKPKTTKHCVGVEIECIFPINAEVARFFLSKLFQEKQLASKTRIGDDGSVKSKNPGHGGLEIRVIDTETNIFNTIVEVCKCIAQLKGYVNNTCGLHIHIDMRTRKYKEVIVHNLIKTQEFLYSMVHKNRAHSNFSVKIPEKIKRVIRYEIDPDNMFRDIPVIEEINRTFLNSTKYAKHQDGLNFGAYRKYRTIEIRMHEGTLSAYRINKWIKILLAIFNKKRKFNKEIPIKAKGLKEIGL